MVFCENMNKKIISLLIICVFIGLSFSPITIGLTQKKVQEKLAIDTEENNFDKLYNLFIEILMKIGHIPSFSAGIIKDDTLIWSKAYGYYDLENQKQATTDTLYIQASVSKTVTATALMQQYELGKFNLSDDISDYLPFTFRNPNHPDMPITIEMVLSHRSSLADDNLYWTCLSYLAGDPDVSDYPMPWLENYFTPNGSAYSPSTWSTALPGEKYYYSNVAFSLIGYLVEIFSGQNFNEYCKEHIFEPLEMYNTSFRLRDQDIDNIAVPYEYIDGEYFRHPQYGIHVIYPAITLRTSINEYSHFIIAHMNGGVWNRVRILNKSTVEMMHTPHFSPTDTFNYGLGWQTKLLEDGKIDYLHSGGYVGALDMVKIKPYDGVGVIYFSNRLDAELHETFIERKMFRLIFDSLFDKAYKLAS